MGYATDKVFGRRETVHIVSPDFLALPKMEIDLGADTVIKAGQFVGVDGKLATLTDTAKAVYLVTEGSHYEDMLKRPKPSKVIEGFFGEMLVHTKVFNEAGTVFAIGDKISVAEGVIVHKNDTNTIAIGEVVKRGDDWIAVVLG